MKAKKKAKSAAPPCLVLPARSSIAQAADIQACLKAWIDAGRPLIVDASHVEEIDTAVLQLLIAAIRTCHMRSLAFSWQASSEALQRAARLIGLSSALELAPGRQPSVAGVA